MKKLLVLAVAILVAGAASAQWNLGGTLGYSSSKLAHKSAEKDMSKSSSLEFGLCPEYAFNNAWSVGLGLYSVHGHSHAYAPGIDLAGDSYAFLFGITGDASKSIVYGFNPYVRRNILTAGNFTIGLLLTADVSFAKVSYTLNDNAVNKNPIKACELSMGISPVVNYRFTEKWSADFHLDLLAIRYSHSTISHEGEFTGKVDDYHLDGLHAGIWGSDYKNDSKGNLESNIITCTVKYNF